MISKKVTDLHISIICLSCNWREQFQKVQRQLLRISMRLNVNRKNVAKKVVDELSC
jgi:hypothetical protein